MTKEMYEDLLERNKLQISELNTLTEEQDKHIAELEKENAELKEQCLILADCNTCHSPCKNENVEIKKQLTKAKEILTKLLEEEKNNTYWEMNGSDKSSYYEVRKQAEQFLKE